jgi:hypothetical protein
LPALSVIVNLPVTLPELVGVNRRLKEQLAPAATVLPLVQVVLGA